MGEGISLVASKSIFLEAGEVKVQSNCLLDVSSKSGAAGTITIKGLVGDLSIDHSKLLLNGFTDGGRVDLSAKANLILTDTSFVGKGQDGKTGGGFIEGSSSFVLDSCNFDLSGTRAGHLLRMGSPNKVTIFNSVLNDIYQTGAGDAIVVINTDASGSVDISQSSFKVGGITEGEVAPGILIRTPGRLTISDTKFDTSSSSSKLPSAGLDLIGQSSVSLSHVSITAKGDAVIPAAVAIYSADSGVSVDSSSDFNLSADLVIQSGLHSHAGKIDFSGSVSDARIVRLRASTINISGRITSDKLITLTTFVFPDGPSTQNLTIDGTLNTPKFTVFSNGIMNTVLVGKGAINAPLFSVQSGGYINMNSNLKFMEGVKVALASNGQNADGYGITFVNNSGGRIILGDNHANKGSLLIQNKGKIEVSKGSKLSAFEDVRIVAGNAIALTNSNPIPPNFALKNGAVLGTNVFFLGSNQVQSIGAELDVKSATGKIILSSSGPEILFKGQNSLLSGVSYAKQTQRIVELVGRCSVVTDASSELKLPENFNSDLELGYGNFLFKSARSHSTQFGQYLLKFGKGSLVLITKYQNDFAIWVLSGYADVYQSADNRKLCSLITGSEFLSPHMYNDVAKRNVVRIDSSGCIVGQRAEFSAVSLIQQNRLLGNICMDLAKNGNLRDSIMKSLSAFQLVTMGHGAFKSLKEGLPSRI